MRGRPKKTLTLTEAEKARLQAWTRRPKSSQRLATRSRIVLACAKGYSNKKVAEKIGICAATVGKWRERFRVHRLEGLIDEPRPGAPRKVSDDQVEEVVTKTLESTPKGSTHWSTRSMAKEVGLGSTTIHRIWRAFGLKPHRTETFKLSPDPQFIEKLRDIVGLYMNPPDHAIVLCVDEKSQIQALDRTQPLLPMRPGQVERRSHDYVRNGTTSLFAALNVKTGHVIGNCHSRHRQQEFVKFLNQVDSEMPDNLDIHIIMDNYGTHKAPAVKRWFERHPRYHVHFTPTYASWVNLVERFFGEITDKAIRRGVFRSVQALKKAIMEYVDVRNKDPKPFVWTTNADLILGRIQRYCERISGTGH